LLAENEELRRRRAELLASQSNLQEKLDLLASEEESLFSARDKIMTQLKELQDKYDLEKMTMEEQIKLLREQIAMSSTSSEEQIVKLRQKIDEVNQDRDRLLDELRKLKEGMKLENEALAEKNAQLRKRLEQEKKEREALQDHLSKIQEEQGRAVIDLHRKLARHVKDMHVWKDFLEQDKDYDSVDLHITMAEDLKGEVFETKVDIVNDAFREETNILANLLLERRGGKPQVNLQASSPRESNHASESASPRRHKKEKK